MTALRLPGSGPIGIFVLLILFLAGRSPGAEGVVTNRTIGTEATTGTNTPAATNATNTTNATNATNGPVTATSNVLLFPVVQELMSRQTEEMLRSHLRLQEQLHSALLAIQQSRLEASVEAQTNVGAMLGRLESLERDLAGQRAQDAQESRDSNRFMMLAAGGIFLVGVLAMVMTVVIQARGMNRLADIAVGLSQARGLAGGMAGALPAASTLSLGAGAGEPLLLGAGADGGRLQTTIRHLEERIRDIESVTQGGVESTAARATAEAPSFPIPSTRSIILAKVQALMNLGQPQAALTVLDDAITREPGDAELQLRKGMALERLKQMDPALEAYDRAIALDARCTQAYLSKGGVLNQQARYQEALACYEQALEYRGRSA